ncbi:MAG: hypothetical protein KIT61_02800 [Pyrinomonadaceae bacterium]|nr:hypothetical protein [Pyrinomonadaceae bacterium]
MKKLLVLLFSITCFGTSVFGQVKYSTYHNSRFFFSIDYPSSLVIMQDPPANNDGRTFLSKDGRVEMRAWGQYNAQFLTVEEQFAEELNGHEFEAITYKTLSKNWFVITGVLGRRVFYQKTLYHRFKETGVFYTFTIEYPESEKRKYDPVVKRIEKSFRFDPNADV